MNAAPRNPSCVPIESREFDALRRLIHEITGIHLGDSKQALVAARLARRLRALGLDTFSEYLAHLQGDASNAELAELTNCITTNTTHFFREPHHFEFLAKTVVPEIIQRARVSGTRRIRIWCAASSKGQEPWSIAMTVRSALGSLAGWDVRILASDIDTDVLAFAEAGIYEESEIADVPATYRDTAFEVASGGQHRVVSELRDIVSFRKINLVAPPWPIRTRFDVVFCRNVAIYFDRPTQQALFENLADLLEPTGYLISGHSEYLHWLGHVIEPAGNTIYRLARNRRVTAPIVATRAADAPTPAEPSRPLVAINAGEMHASREGDRIRTTLGSCVAACLHDPVARVGGMNHFMLPDGESAERSLASFGVHAMEMLINAMMKLGADRSRLVAKVFGASDMLAAGAGANGVAAQNARFALDFLRDEGISVVAQKLGGNRAMCIELDTESGRVQLRTIDRDPAVAQAESAHRASLARATSRPEDAITIFQAAS